MVYVVKFLGVIHCNMTITLELSKNMAIIICMHTSAKYLLDKNACLKLYYSQYLSSVSCCCKVWGNIYKTQFNCNYLLQKQLARIVSNVHYCHHTNGLSCELHILKLSDFVKLNTAIIMCDANKKFLPNNLLLLFNSLLTQHVKHDKVKTYDRYL